MVGGRFVAVYVSAVSGSSSSILHINLSGFSTNY